MYVTFDKCVFHFQLNLYLNILISWEERLGLKAIFHSCYEHVHLYVSYRSVKNSMWSCTHVAQRFPLLFTVGCEIAWTCNNNVCYLRHSLYFFTSIGEMICLIGLFIHRRKERLKYKQVCISLNTSIHIILHFYVFYGVTEQWHMQPHGIFLCTWFIIYTY